MYCINIIKGFNYRRSKCKPKQFTAFEKRQRLLFAMNNIGNNFHNTVCIDESSIWAMRQDIYHHHRTSSCPKTNALNPPNPVKVHIWGGISWAGPIPFVLFDNNLT